MTGTTRIRSFNAVQLGLVLGVLYAILAFIAGIFEALFVSYFSFAPSSSETNFGAMNFLIFPIGGIIGGFIGGFLYGLIGGALYNLVAGWVGGIELQLEARL